MRFYAFFRGMMAAAMAIVLVASTALSVDYECDGLERSRAEYFSRPIRRLKLPVIVHVESSLAAYRFRAMRFIEALPEGILEYTPKRDAADVYIRFGNCKNAGFVAGCFDRRSGNIEVTRNSMYHDNTVEHELIHLLGFSHDDNGMRLDGNYSLKNPRVRAMIECAYGEQYD